MLKHEKKKHRLKKPNAKKRSTIAMKSEKI
jgi:hypothetical protein